MSKCILQAHIRDLRDVCAHDACASMQPPANLSWLLAFVHLTPIKYLSVYVCFVQAFAKCDNGDKACL